MRMSERVSDSVYTPGRDALQPARRVREAGWLAARAVPLASWALSTLVVLVYAWRSRGFREDDVLIYARYARNFLAGFGLVYNPGELHNAVTSPLFVWLLIGAGRAGWDIPTAAYLLGALCTLITVYLLIFALFPRDVAPWVGAAAGLLYA